MQAPGDIVLDLTQAGKPIRIGGGLQQVRNITSFQSFAQLLVAIGCSQLLFVVASTYFGFYYPLSVPVPWHRQEQAYANKGTLHSPQNAVVFILAIHFVSTLCQGMSMAGLSEELAQFTLAI